MKRITGQFSNEKLAKRYGTTERGIRRWRADGCPFSKGEDHVWSWLATRRTLPARTKELLEVFPTRQRKAGPGPSPDGPPGDEGAAHTARRAEQLERESFRALQSSIERGDLVGANHLLKRWDMATTQVRKFNESIPAERRIGEQIPMELAKDVIRRLCWWLRTTLRESLLHASIAHYPTGMQAEAGKVLSKATDGYLLSLASAVTTWGLFQEGGCRGGFPAWAVSAMQDQLRNVYPGTELSEQGRQMQQILTEVTAAQTSAELEAASR